MNAHPRRRGCTVLLSAMLAGTLVGCDGVNLNLPTLPEKLPSKLRFVVKHKNRFAQDRTAHINKITPGTIIDDLSALDGCWGAALLPVVDVTDEPIAAIYFVHEYRAEAGSVRSWALANVLGQYRIALSEGTGRFQTLDGNRLVTQAVLSGSYDVLTGELETHAVTDPHPREMLATLDGDSLRLHFGAPDRKPVDPGDDTVYQRFECPK